MSVTIAAAVVPWIPRCIALSAESVYDSQFVVLSCFSCGRHRCKKNVFFTFLTLFLFSVRFFLNKSVENLLSMQANSEIQFFVRNVS